MAGRVPQSDLSNTAQDKPVPCVAELEDSHIDEVFEKLDLNETTIAMDFEEHSDTYGEDVYQGDGATHPLNIDTAFDVEKIYVMMPAADMLLCPFPGCNWTCAQTRTPNLTTALQHHEESEHKLAKENITGRCRNCKKCVPLSHTSSADSCHCFTHNYTSMTAATTSQDSSTNAPTSSRNAVATRVQVLPSTSSVMTHQTVPSIVEHEEFEDSDNEVDQSYFLDEDEELDSGELQDAAELYDPDDEGVCEADASYPSDEWKQRLEFYQDQLKHLMEKPTAVPADWQDFCRCVEDIQDWVRNRNNIKLPALKITRVRSDHVQSQSYIRTQNATTKNIQGRNIHDVTCDIFTSADILASLKSMEDVAPGPDKITYKHWLAREEHSVLLEYIFAICHKHCKIPPSWKQSNTVMVPIKPTSPFNPYEEWHKIQLYNTIYILYNTLLFDIVSAWLEENSILDDGIKGGRPWDGVFETLQFLDVTRRSALKANKKYVNYFFKLQDAFTSICHESVIKSLSDHGCGSFITNLVADMFTDFTTTIPTNHGELTELRLKKGLSISLPLSRCLFNIAINPIFKRLNTLHERRRHLIGYSDSWVSLAENGAELQENMNMIYDALQLLNLEVDLTNIVVDDSKYEPLAPLEFRSAMYGRVSVRHLSRSENQDLLGRSIHALSSNDITKLFDSLKRKFVVLEKCLLAEWQKLDAIFCFVLPKVGFHVKNALIKKEHWNKLDIAINPIIKSCLNLRKETCKAFIHADPNKGGLGLPSFADLYDIHKVCNMFQLLATTDMNLRESCRNELLQTCLSSNENQLCSKDKWKLITTYLSTRATACQSGYLWTEALNASKRLGLTWGVTSVSVSIMDSNSKVYSSDNPNDRRILYRSLVQNKRADYFAALRSLECQGRVFESVGAHRISSDFLNTKTYWSDEEYSTNWTQEEYVFVINARLGLLEHRSHTYNKNPFCRHGCSDIVQSTPVLETLGHIFDTCTGSGTLALNFQRRNFIIEELKERATVAGFDIVSTDANLVISKLKKLYIIDVSSLFEESYNHLTSRHADILKNCQGFVDSFWQDAKYTDITAYGFVVGALGSWCHLNQAVVDLLVTTCDKKTQFKRNCIYLAIKGSYNIYQHHIRQD